MGSLVYFQCEANLVAVDGTIASDIWTASLLWAKRFDDYFQLSDYN